MITLSYILFGVGNIINIGITIRNKMKYLPPTVIGSAMVNHVFNYLLIPSYSMMGAAWATIISRLVFLMVRITVNWTKDRV